MKRGFTLLEVLVASMLMGMLVTILTMIFNQSAIAWRTGKAGVADMSETERRLSCIHAYADSVVPFTGGDKYCVAQTQCSLEHFLWALHSAQGLARIISFHRCDNRL